LRLFSFGGYGLALAALALVVFGAIECPSFRLVFNVSQSIEKPSPSALYNMAVNSSTLKIDLMRLTPTSGIQAVSKVLTDQIFWNLRNSETAGDTNAQNKIGKRSR